jgi:hypothetical protein
MDLYRRVYIHYIESPGVPHGGPSIIREAKYTHLIGMEESPKGSIGDPFISAAYIHLGI